MVDPETILAYLRTCPDSRFTYEEIMEVLGLHDDFGTQVALKRLRSARQISIVPIMREGVYREGYACAVGV